MKVPTCHPDRKFHAMGQCESCYKFGRRKAGKRANCHPSKPHAGQGLCRTCHNLQVVRPNHPIKYRRIQKNSDLKKKYGITLVQYEALVAACGNKCAICKRGPSGVGRAGILYVDHDHATGEMRGLLCAKCNIMLGGSRDVPETLEAGAAYLRQYAARKECPAA
jgi:hypothetical protein